MGEEIIGRIILIINFWVFFSFVTMIIVKTAANGKISGGMIFLTSFLFSPICGILVGILEVISMDKESCMSEKEHNVASNRASPNIMIEKGTKRIKICENEKEYYLTQGWTIVSSTGIDNGGN